jgi:DNA-directed RNA polymerase I, II, and III subunit RPABC2
MKYSQHLIRYPLAFALFLVVKHSPKKHAAPKKTATKTAAKGKKAGSKAKVVEIEFELKEIDAQGSKVLIGPPRLTRFERARITGARSLQLSLGAPPLIKVPDEARSSIMLAVAEVEHKALPISIRRILPNGRYQDIPTDWMK